MIESHFEVNVAIIESERALHWCRIRLPANLFRAEAVERARVIAAKFGDGFKVSLTWVECHGESIAI